MSRWPSVGFVLLLVVLCLVGAFFAFALQTPALDELWTLEGALKVGDKTHLKKHEAALFYRAIGAYPDYRNNLFENRTMAILSGHVDGRLPDSRGVIIWNGDNGCARFSVEVSGDPTVFPVTLVASGRFFQKKVVLSKSGEARFSWPPNGGRPEILELRARTKDEWHEARVNLKVRLCKADDQAI